MQKQNQLQKIFNLINRTGEKMVIFDSQNNKSYVVLDIDKYERIMDFRELEFMDEWEEDEEDNDNYEEDYVFNGMPGDNVNEDESDDIPEVNMDEFYENEDDNDDLMIEEDFLPNNSQYYEKEEELDRNYNYGKIDQKSSQKRWEIPHEVKNTNLDENNNEDRYYLEHI